MQTFCWYLHGALLLLRNEKSAYMELILNVVVVLEFISKINSFNTNINR